MAIPRSTPPGRPVFGGKQPRSQYRSSNHSESKADYSVVIFLDKDLKKSDDQEVVPTSWIENGSPAYVKFPVNPTRRQLEKLIEENAPYDNTWEKYPVYILATECTLEEAREVESGAVKSSAENPTSERKRGSAADWDRNLTSEESDEESANEKGAKKKTKIKKKSKKKKNDKDSTIKSLQKEKSFQFGSDDDKSDGTAEQLVLQPRQSSVLSRQSVRTNLVSRFEGLKSLVPERPAPVVKTLPQNTTQSTTPQQFLVSPNENAILTPSQMLADSRPATKGDLKSLQLKIFVKLNKMESLILQQNPVTSIQLSGYPPKVLEGVGKLPADSIEQLENLDEVLADASLQTEMVNFLVQLGGRKLNEFLIRAIPKLVSDSVCQFTNWSGSEFKEKVDIDGNPITRTHKKTFANLTNIVAVFCGASKIVVPGCTDLEVEDYIKRYLLNCMDRLKPRPHSSGSSEKTGKPVKKSPRKKTSRLKKSTK